MTMPRAFERMILIPLDILALLWAVSSFLHKDWFTGAVLLLFSLLVGMIGQALHSRLGAGELAQGRHWQDEPEGGESDLLSPEDSVKLGKALLHFAFVCGITSTLLWAHWKHSWLWALAIGIGAFAAVFVLAGIVVYLIGLWSRRARRVVL